MNVSRANALAAAIFFVGLVGYLPYAPVRLYDFRAFYCAGKAVVARSDPYREQSLHSCERNSIAVGMSAQSDDITVPAPLPGYVLAIFALLALLPFGICALLWLCASLVAVVLSIELLQRAIGIAMPTVAVVIFLPAAIVAMPLGQTAPFVEFGVALCAYGLTRARWRLAAVGALITAFDPAVAIVLCGTLAYAVPSTRLVILTGSAALIALSLLTLSSDINVEYVTRVLHAHALGNVAERTQFSVTHFAWVAGLASGPAVLVGTCWYAASAATGAWIAMLLRARFGIAALALVPPAFAVFGGVYVHFSQLVLALPAFLLALRQPSAMRWLPVNIFFIAVPWFALAAFPPFAIALFALAVAYARDIAGVRAGLRLGLASAMLLIVFFAAALMTAEPVRAAFHTIPMPGALAESAWSRYVLWRDPQPDRLLVLLQIPTVGAFVACISALVLSAISAKRPLT